MAKAKKAAKKHAPKAVDWKNEFKQVTKAAKPAKKTKKKTAKKPKSVLVDNAGNPVHGKKPAILHTSDSQYMEKLLKMSIAKAAAKKTKPKKKKKARTEKPKKKPEVFKPQAIFTLMEYVPGKFNADKRYAELKKEHNRVDLGNSVEALIRRVVDLEQSDHILTQAAQAHTNYIDRLWDLLAKLQDELEDATNDSTNIIQNFNEDRPWSSKD